MWMMHCRTPCTIGCRGSSYQAEIHAFLQMWRKTVDKGGGYTETLHIHLIRSTKQKIGTSLFDEPVY